MPTRRELFARLAALPVLALGARADASPERAFTDAELRAALANHDRGLIYVWSPHMPYSVSGLTEILELGRQQHLTVIALLDPFADAQLTAASVSRFSLPASATRRVGSGRLLRRGVTLHYPALLVFRDGRLDDQLLPGYTTPAAYLDFINARLAA